MSDRRSGPVEVLVVGAGPAGLVAAITLSRYGVRVLVVERRAEVSGLSRALVVSTRSMELLRGWGLEDAVREGAAAVEPMAWVTPTLASREGTAMPLGYPTAAEAAAVSPTRPAWAPQSHVEPLLVSLLAGAPTAELRFRSELIGLEGDDEGAQVVLVDGATGGTEVVEARYVIGADGAHSSVRRHLGITMEGPDDLGEYHRIEFEAPLLELVGEHRFGLYVVTRPDVGAVLAPRGRGDRWGITREWQPGQPRLADATDAEATDLIRRAAGADVPVRLDGANVFSFSAQLADRYRSGSGFVIGDAAHRMTPRGGTGMNTAVQDGFDLGWKLAWVLRGWAGAELLDTYESEHQPVGEHNVGRAGDAGGAQRHPSEALPWDLGGRVAHHWLTVDGRSVSTLDLLGDGITLLTGPGGSDDDWTTRLRTPVPVVTHRLDGPTAGLLGIVGDGALLLRPDGKELARWLDPAARHAPSGLPGLTLG